MGPRQHSPPLPPSPPPVRSAEGRTTTYRASTRIDAERHIWAGLLCKVQKQKQKKKSGKRVISLKAKLEFWIVCSKGMLTAHNLWNRNLCESRDSSKFKWGVKKPRVFLLHYLIRNVQQKEAFIPDPPTPCFIVELNYFAIILIVWSNTSTETICKETCI